MRGQEHSAPHEDVQRQNSSTPLRRDPTRVLLPLRTPTALRPAYSAVALPTVSAARASDTSDATLQTHQGCTRRRTQRCQPKFSRRRCMGPGRAGSSAPDSGGSSSLVPRGHRRPWSGDHRTGAERAIEQVTNSPPLLWCRWGTSYGHPISDNLSEDAPDNKFGCDCPRNKKFSRRGCGRPRRCAGPGATGHVLKGAP